jgi:hypothetical protein
MEMGEFEKNLKLMNWETNVPNIDDLVEECGDSEPENTPEEEDLPPGLDDWNLLKPFQLKINGTLIDFCRFFCGNIRATMHDAGMEFEEVVLSPPKKRFAIDPSDRLPQRIDMFRNLSELIRFFVD